jgi:hypothetical protein
MGGLMTGYFSFLPLIAKVPSPTKETVASGSDSLSLFQPIVAFAGGFQ